MERLTMSTNYFTPADIANDYGIKVDTVRMRIRTLAKKGIVFETDDYGHWLISEEQIPLIIEMGRRKPESQESLTTNIKVFADPMDEILEEIRKENEEYRRKLKINENLENAIIEKKKVS
jgi:DNA-binding Lrp family transcriptional regulator